MDDLIKIAPKLIENGLLVAVLTYAVVTLWKKYVEVQEKLTTDSIDREKTVTIALETVTHELADMRKTITISLDKRNDKN